MSPMGPGRGRGVVDRIVTDARVLEPGFVPESVPHRSEELDALAGALEPARRGEPPEPAVLSGPPGAGKTCTARYAIRQLASRGDVAVQHVDCGRADGRFDVLRRLLAGADLPTYDLHRGSTPRAVLMDRLAAGLRTRYVAVLDGVGQLRDADVLYGLRRVPALTLVVISSRAEELFASLDPRLRSRLCAGVRVDFDRYGEAALVEILRRRVDRGLAAGALDGAQVRRIAAAADGDAGRAVRTVRAAARLARRAGADAVDDDVLAAAIRRAAGPRRDVDDLPADLRVLYELVREADGLAPAELYERYRDRVPDPKTRRTVRTYLADLADDGFVRAEGETRRRRYFATAGGGR